MDFRRRFSARTVVTVLTGLWTMVVGFVAYFAPNHGLYPPVVWWAIFPLGWGLVHRGTLSDRRQHTIVVGTTLLGSALIIAGSWMEWPVTGPFSPYVLRTHARESIERGYQFFDLPLVALAIVAGLSVTRSGGGLGRALISLVTGLCTFLWIFSITALWTDAFWTFTWTFYVPVGGAICLVYAGLFGLLSLNNEQYAAMDPLPT